MTAPRPQPIELRIALERFLVDRLAKIRAGLIAEGKATKPAGSRLPIQFGDDPEMCAGFVHWPATFRKATVTGPAALLAWAKKNYPAKVKPVETIDPKHMKDVLAVLADHLPEAIVKTTEPDPQWVDDLQKSLAEPDGTWTGADSKEWAEIPGITVTTAGGTPTASFSDDAGHVEAVFREAWQQGLITPLDLLGIEAPPPEPDPTPLDSVDVTNPDQVG